MVSHSVIKKNFVFSFGEKLLRAVLTFISLGIVARYLGPSEYGVLSYLLALITYFQLLGAFGLDHLLIRMMAQNQAEKAKIFWQSTAFKGVMSLVSLVLYFLFLSLSGKASALGYLFGFAIFYAVFDNLRILLEMENRHHAVAKVEMIYQITSACLKIGISEIALSRELLLAVFVLDFFIPRILLFRAAKSSIMPFVKPQLEFKEFAKYARSGFFYCSNAILVIVYMKIDQVIIGNMLGMETLGNYAAAVRISDAWYFLPMTVSAIFYPLALSGGKNEEEKYLQLIFDLIVWISLGIIIPALVFSDEIFGIMFGEKFHVDKTVLDLLFYSGFFISLNIATAAWLNVKNNGGILFARSLLGSALNIAANFYLLPKYGLVGGAWATLVAYGVTIIVTMFAGGAHELIRYFMSSLNPLKVVSRIKSILVH